VALSAIFALVSPDDFAISMLASTALLVISLVLAAICDAESAAALPAAAAAFAASSASCFALSHRSLIVVSLRG
jgi:hypothetical protein